VYGAGGFAARGRLVHRKTVGTAKKVFLICAKTKKATCEAAFQDSMTAKLSVLE